MTVWQHVPMRSEPDGSDIEVFDNPQPADPGSPHRDDVQTGDTTINIAPYARVTFATDTETGRYVARIQYRIDQPTPMISMQGQMASDLYRELQRRATPTPSRQASKSLR